MGKALILVCAFLVVALAVAVGFILGARTFQHDEAPQETMTISGQSPSSVPSAATAVTPSVIPSLTTPITPSLTSSVTLTPVPISSPVLTSSATPVKRNVIFNFEVRDISGTGFSRVVTAQVVNAGNLDAHNTWAKVEASSGGAPIALNGQEYLRVNIGDLNAGSSVSRQVTLGFSFLDGIKISNQGVRLVVTINSDENSNTFSYDFKP